MGTYEEESKLIVEEAKRRMAENKKYIEERLARDTLKAAEEKKKKEVQETTKDDVKKFIHWSFQYVQDPITGETGPMPGMDPRLIHQAEDFLKIAEQPLSLQDHLEGFRLIEELGKSFMPKLE